LSALAPAAAADGDAYLLVWVGDDPNETDGDPLRDGTEPDDPGRGILMLVAHAYGAGGGRRMIEAAVSRRSPVDAPPRPRLLTWREMR
jgi:hypothetical protein